MPARVIGGTVIRRRLKLIRRNVLAEMARELDDAADDLLTRARTLAPQLTGALIASGKIKKRRARQAVSRTIWFDCPYAVVRHEDVYNLGPISSRKSSPEGPIGRKYLSRPFERHAPRYRDNLANAVNRAMRQSLR